jgi:hypothetical protein
VHSGHHRNVIEGNMLLKIADLELNNNDSFYTQMRYNCCNSATMTSLCCYFSLVGGKWKGFQCTKINKNRKIVFSIYLMVPRVERQLLDQNFRRKNISTMYIQTPIRMHIQILIKILPISTKRAITSYLKPLNIQNDNNIWRLISRSCLVTVASMWRG